MALPTMRHFYSKCVISSGRHSYNACACRGSEMSKAKELFDELSGHLRGNVADPASIMALINGVNSFSKYAQKLEVELAELREFYDAWKSIKEFGGRYTMEMAEAEEKIEARAAKATGAA